MNMNVHTQDDTLSCTRRRRAVRHVSMSRQAEKPLYVPRFQTLSAAQKRLPEPKVRPHEVLENGRHEIPL